MRSTSAIPAEFGEAELPEKGVPKLELEGVPEFTLNGAAQIWGRQAPTGPVPVEPKIDG